MIGSPVSKENIVFIGPELMEAIDNDDLSNFQKNIDIIIGASKEGKAVECFMGKKILFKDCKRLLFRVFEETIDNRHELCFKAMVDTVLKFKEDKDFKQYLSQDIASFIEGEKLLYLIETGLLDLNNEYMRSSILHSIYEDNPGYIETLVNHGFVKLNEDRFKGLLSDVVASEFDGRHAFLLLGLGADINERTAEYQNLTPLEIAHKYNCHEIIDCINEYINEQAIKTQQKLHKEIKDNAVMVRKIKNRKIPKIKELYKKPIGKIR